VLKDINNYFSNSVAGRMYDRYAEEKIKPQFNLNNPSNGIQFQRTRFDLVVSINKLKSFLFKNRLRYMAMVKMYII